MSSSCDSSSALCLPSHPGPLGTFPARIMPRARGLGTRAPERPHVSCRRGSGNARNRTAERLRCGCGRGMQPRHATRSNVARKMPERLHELQFLERCLALDLETSRDGRILEIGAVQGERSFVWRGGSPLAEALAGLDRFAAGAAVVLGHNLLGHDPPVLGGWCRKTSERPAMLAVPAIDTLVLSPLAFPEIPYHRLGKGLKPL